MLPGVNTLFASELRCDAPLRPGQTSVLAPFPRLGFCTWPPWITIMLVVNEFMRRETSNDYCKEQQYSLLRAYSFYRHAQILSYIAFIAIQSQHLNASFQNSCTMYCLVNFCMECRVRNTAPAKCHRERIPYFLLTATTAYEACYSTQRLHCNLGLCDYMEILK